MLALLAGTGTSCLLAPAARADGDCDSRRLSAAEQRWVDETFSVLRGALPRTPDGWVSYAPHELDGSPAPPVDAGKPDRICTDAPGPMPMRVSADFTPRDSALAQMLSLRSRQTALRRDDAREEEGMAAAATRAGAGDLMTLQQELMAAQARGDMAAMQRLAEQLSQQTGQMSQAQQGAIADSMATSDGLRQSAAAEARLADEIEGLRDAAAQAPRVNVVIDLNPASLGSRQKPSSRELQLPGATAAWIDSDAGTCGIDNAPDIAQATAILGAVRIDRDNSMFVSYEPAGSGGATTQRRNAVVQVCGRSADAERFLRMIRFEALRP
ncbi:MAG: hypothetical protein WC809_12360 [Sinimarinibacterium sp.]